LGFHVTPCWPKAVSVSDSISKQMDLFLDAIRHFAAQ